ncbi:DNA polymerase I, partial [Roseiflexus sp. AH-315-K22]|nr:DNA polymerase I [Roseiflexus sp. AH-315-K22]
ELASMLKAIKAAPVVAVDTETTGLRPLECKLCGLSFAVQAGAAWYVPVRSPEPESHLDEKTVLDALRDMLEDESIPKVGHNLKYDLLVLRNHNVELRGFTRTPGGMDTMIASYLIDASRSSHSLDALSLALLGRQNVSIKELIGTGKSQKTFDRVPLEQASPYAAEDADVSLQIAAILEPQLIEMGLDGLARDLELPLVEVLAELEWNGIQVEPDELDRQRERIEGRIVELREQIQTLSMETVGRGFDVDSPKQLSGILFNDPEAAEPGMGIKPTKKTKTGFSTDVEVLDKLDANPAVETPIPKLVLEYRQLAKLVNTYLVALKDAINPNTKRIHASFNQTVAATGRLSSSDPNLQNIPIRTEIGREIRRAFVAPPGRVLVSADYSQIELRLLAHLSRDPGLIDAFQGGQDIHAAVASQVYSVPLDEVTREQRSGAKMVNFGIVYGITPFGLARRLDISNTEADEIITGYKKRFAGITTFLEECAQQAKEKGYVETMLKRRRPIPDIESNNPQRRALAERMAINSVVQGSAADLIKIAMIDLHGRLSEHAGGWRRGASEESARRADVPLEESARRANPPEIAGVKMLLQIHDELVFEAPEATAEAVKALVVERMQNAMNLTVPLVADASIASNWYEGK